MRLVLEFPRANPKITRLVVTPEACFDDHVRMLFSTTAGAGHFGPMIPIAHACAAAGHAVAVAAPASFERSVTKAGLAHLPFPDVPADQIGAVYSQLPSLPRDEANRVVVTRCLAASLPRRPSRYCLPLTPSGDRM